jgi:hypothetical protein
MGAQSPELKYRVLHNLLNIMRPTCGFTGTEHAAHLADLAGSRVAVPVSCGI